MLSRLHTKTTRTVALEGLIAKSCSIVERLPWKSWRQTIITEIVGMLSPRLISCLWAPIAAVAVDII